MSPATLLALALTSVLFALAALHLYWMVVGVSGGRALPERPDGTLPLRPGRTASFAVALALSVAGGIVLGRAGLAFGAVPRVLFRVGTWGIAAAFGARTIGEFRYVGVFKRVRSTDFARWDTWLFTPLCAGLAGAAAVLAMS
jgi:hypothetical protein